MWSKWALYASSVKWKVLRWGMWPCRACLTKIHLCRAAWHQFEPASEMEVYTFHSRICPHTLKRSRISCSLMKPSLSKSRRQQSIQPATAHRSVGLAGAVKHCVWQASLWQNIWIRTCNIRKPKHASIKRRHIDLVSIIKIKINFRARKHQKFKTNIENLSYALLALFDYVSRVKPCVTICSIKHY